MPISDIFSIQGWLRQVDGFWERGDFTGAAHACQRALAIDPGHGTALITLAVGLGKFQNEPEQAIRLFSRGRYLMPHNAAIDEIFQTTFRTCLQRIPILCQQGLREEAERLARCLETINGPFPPETALLVAQLLTRRPKM